MEVGKVLEAGEERKPTLTCLASKNMLLYDLVRCGGNMPGNVEYEKQIVFAGPESRLTVRLYPNTCPT